MSELYLLGGLELLGALLLGLEARPLERGPEVGLGRDFQLDVELLGRNSGYEIYYTERLLVISKQSCSNVHLLGGLELLGAFLLGLEARREHVLELHVVHFAAKQGFRV